MRHSIIISRAIHDIRIYLFILTINSVLSTEPDTDFEGETPIGEFVICRQCGSDITLSNSYIYKSSPVALSFANRTFYEQPNVLVQELQNPYGIKFEVATLKQSECAETDQSWSHSYTWFPGYSWKICFCPKCSKHLGWMFEPTESAISTLKAPTKAGFYAIITKSVIGETYVNSLIIIFAGN